MTLDISKDRKSNRKLTKIDLINRRYSNPNEYDSINNTLDDSTNNMVMI